MSMVLEELVAELGWDLKNEDDLRRFKSGMQDAEKSLAAFTSRVSAFAAAAGAALGAGMIALGRSVIGVSAEFEGFQTSLETLEGSSEKAKASMDWIADFAKKTPYELAGITESFIKLKAYGIDPMNGALETLGDTASAMNKPLDQAVEAFADATNFQFERLREFNVTATQAGDNVTFQWTKNGKQLTQVVRKNGAEIQRFLLDHFGASFGGAMIRQSRTWNGLVSNMSDDWNDFLKGIGEKGFFEVAKANLAGFRAQIAELDSQGVLTSWQQRLSDILSLFTKIAGAVGTRLVRHLGFAEQKFGALSAKVSELINGNPEAFAWIKAGLIAIGAYMFPTLSAIMVLEDVLSFIEGDESILGNIAKELERITGIEAGTIGTTLATIAGTGAGLFVASKAIRAVSGAISGLSGALASMAGDAVAEGLDNLGETERKGRRPRAPKGKTNLSGLAVTGAIAGVAVGAAIIESGKQEILSDPAKAAQATPEANKQRIADRRAAIDGFLSWLTDGDSQTSANVSSTLAMDEARRARSAGLGQSPGKVADDLNVGLARMQELLANGQANMARMEGGNAAAAITNTITDNADRSVTVNSTVNQTVTQATNAPAAAANATSRAVAGAAQRSLPPTRILGNTGAF